MEAIDDQTFEDQLLSETDAYLNRVEDCVFQLQTLLDQYVAESSYKGVVDLISEIESDCDQLNRRISALISNSNARKLGIKLTRLHVNSRPTIQLYQLLDEIANAVEQFAEEIDAISPPIDEPCLDRLREMADIAIRTMTVLKEAVTDYVRVLCQPDTAITLTAEIGRIRTAESRCDKLRTEVIATAFSDGPSPTALVYRELALLLDQVVDTMEDVTDQMILIIGNQSWIEIESEESEAA